jgi:hypothetical protein
MADFIIPTRTDSEDYEVEVELGGVAYLLRFTWNYRESFWYLTISDTDSNVIAGNIKVVISKPLLLEISNEDKPNGQLIAVDTSGADIEAGLDELGDRVLLFWDGT